MYCLSLAPRLLHHDAMGLQPVRWNHEVTGRVNRSHAKCSIGYGEW